MADNQIILFKPILAVYLYECSCHFSGLVFKREEDGPCKTHSLKKKRREPSVISLILHLRYSFFPACQPAES